MLALAGVYVVVCALAKSAVNWSLMGAVMYLLLNERIPRTTTLSVLLIADVQPQSMPKPMHVTFLNSTLAATGIKRK